MSPKEELINWLSINIDSLFKNEAKRRELSNLLSRIHPELRWEIGPGVSEKRFFALSPNLDENLLSVTKELISNFPNINGWEFFASKPRKTWNKRVIKALVDGKDISLDFSQWRYQLVSFNDDEFFDIHYIPNIESQLAVDDVDYLADLFSEFELGEELYMKRIDKIHVKREKTGANLGDEISNLYPHLCQLTVSVWR